MVIDLCDTEEQMQRMTVKQLKEKIVERLPEFADDTRLIFTNKSLEGDSTLLSEYGIEHKSVIHMVIKVSGGGSISGTGDGGMGDKGGKNRSMEMLPFF